MCTAKFLLVSMGGQACAERGVRTLSVPAESTTFYFESCRFHYGKQPKSTAYIVWLPPLSGLTENKTKPASWGLGWAWQNKKATQSPIICQLAYFKLCLDSFYLVGYLLWSHVLPKPRRAVRQLPHPLPFTLYIHSSVAEWLTVMARSGKSKKYIRPYRKRWVHINLINEQ